MVKTKKTVTWFIFPNDDYTRDEIKSGLTEIAVNKLKCSDGKKRKLWKCNTAFIAKMKRNKGMQGLLFDIYKQEGKDGLIKKSN